MEDIVLEKYRSLIKKKLLSPKYLTMQQDIENGCKYEGNLTRNAECLMYSGKKEKTGYCTDWNDFFEDFFGGYQEFFSNYTYGSCPFGNPVCDKAIDTYGVCKAYETWGKIYRFELENERLYPDNLGKPYTKLMEGYKSRCYQGMPWWAYLLMMVLALFSALIPLLL